MRWEIIKGNWSSDLDEEVLAWTNEVLRWIEAHIPDHLAEFVVDEGVGLPQLYHHLAAEPANTVLHLDRRLVGLRAVLRDLRSS